MTAGTISFDPATQGSAYIAALEAAGIAAVLRPDGLYVSDTAAAAAISDAAVLAQAQAIQVAAVDDLRDARIAAGWAYQGATYQIDADSQAQIAAMGALASAVLSGVSGAAWPAGMVWIDAANVPHAMTAGEMFAFAQAVAGYVSSTILRARALKDSVLTATSLTDLAAIDITAGWPV